MGKKGEFYFLITVKYNNTAAMHKPEIPLIQCRLF